MSLVLAETLVSAMAMYMLIGGLVGVLMSAWGAGRIDPSAETMPILARILIFPGLVLLWPLMLIKLFTQKEPPLS